MNNWLKSKKGCQKLSIDNLLSIIKTQNYLPPGGV